VIDGGPPVTGPILEKSIVIIILEMLASLDDHKGDVVALRDIGSMS